MFKAKESHKFKMNHNFNYCLTITSKQSSLYNMLISNLYRDTICHASANSIKYRQWEGNTYRNHNFQPFDYNSELPDSRFCGTGMHMDMDMHMLF